ncbi:MAG: response regulator [bacterium]
MDTTPINILLVEDNDDDIVIIKKVFKRLKLTNPLYIVHNGEEALDFLFHKGAYSSLETSPKPGLIFLDINMPIMDGFTTLERLKQNPQTKCIPVIMLTVSDREEDIVKSYANGAVSYVTKPMDFEQFVKVIEQFDIYWTLVSKIPK